jgi:cell division protein FtsW (lipid II flippase)
MEANCAICGRSWEREPGFYLGSIYFNYGLTALILAVVYPILLFRGVASNQVLLVGSLIFCVLFPIWFHRYARSLWLALDEWFDPQSDGPQPPVDQQVTT